MAISCGTPACDCRTCAQAQRLEFGVERLALPRQFGAQRVQLAFVAFLESVVRLIGKSDQRISARVGSAESRSFLLRSRKGFQFSNAGREVRNVLRKHLQGFGGARRTGDLLITALVCPADGVRLLFVGGYGRSAGNAPSCSGCTDEKCATKDEQLYALASSFHGLTSPYYRQGESRTSRRTDLCWTGVAGMRGSGSPWAPVNRALPARRQRPPCSQPAGRPGRAGRCLQRPRRHRSTPRPGRPETTRQLGPHHRTA